MRACVSVRVCVRELIISSHMDHESTSGSTSIMTPPSFCTPPKGRQGEALPQNNILPHLPPPSWMHVRFNPPFTVKVQDSPPPHYCCGLLCSQPCVLNPLIQPPTTTTRTLPRMSRAANAVTTATGGRLTSIAPPFFQFPESPPLER